MARPPKSRWSIKWSDTQIFKAEQEGDNISPSCVDDWCRTLDAQLEERFGQAVPAKLSAASLNFSRCNLDDTALTKLLTYLYSRDITVQILKLFRNNITDSGAWAVGQFMAHSSQAVHEVHLSHNSISEQGAAALLELIVWSQKYPYLAENTGRRDARGYSPIWLRLEHNCIDWRLIDHRLHRPDLTWTTAESRDNWPPMGEAAPTICLHASFRNQYDSHEHGWDDDGKWAPAPYSPDDGGSVLLKALKGDSQVQESIDRSPPGARMGRPAPLGAAVTAPVPKQPVSSPVLSTSPLAADRGGYPSPSAARPAKGPLSSTPLSPSQATHGSSKRGPVQQLPEKEAVPLFVFLDVGAAHQMLTREDGLWRFSSLLTLAATGHMKCSPPDGSGNQVQPWVSPVQEAETTLILITDDVVTELGKRQEDPYVRQELDRYGAQDPNSLLQQCEDWGFVEVVETNAHTSLMHIDKQMEARATELQVSPVSLKVLDFACLWQQQTEAPGRVLVITEDVALRFFSTELSASMFPGVILLGELNQLLFQDDTYGGRILTEISAQPRPRPPMQPTFQGAMLYAALICKVASFRPQKLPSEMLDRLNRTDGFPVLRQEMHEALSVLTKVLRLVRAGHGAGNLTVADQAAQTTRTEALTRRLKERVNQVY